MQEVAYFKLVQSFFASHFYTYDNSCEGIRNGCTEGEREICSYQKMANRAQVREHWRSKPISHILPPIPYYGDIEEGFHYCNPEQILEGDIPEKFSFCAKIVTDACSRQFDDYCPRKQLEKLIDSCGEPVLKNKKEIHGGSVTLSIIDENNTLQKCFHKVNDFVEEYVGEDMQSITGNELKRRHEIKVRPTILKQETASAKAIEKAKTFEDLDWKTLVNTNTLNKLYVSPLHPCLTSKMVPIQMPY